MSSRLDVELEAQVELLERLLLANLTTAFPTPLSPEEQVALSAYVVLSHACIEEYIEDMFLAQYDRLSTSGESALIPQELARLSLSVGIELPEAMRVSYKTRTLEATLRAGRENYIRLIKANHGIRPANIMKLARGVGLDWMAFEDALSSQLADLDTLGAKRGQAGHLSPFSSKAMMVVQHADPDDVRDWVSAARDSALRVDEYLVQGFDAQLLALSNCSF